MASSSVVPSDQQLKTLRSTLETAIAHRGRYYSDFLTFAWRFAADDTAAYRDTAHFQNMLKALKLPSAQELVVPKDDRYPAWTVQDAVRQLLRNRTKISGRVLIITHYAGHGVLGDDNQLYFTSNSSGSAKVRFESTIGQLASQDQPLADTDIVLILDSCFSGTATRATNIEDRSVEIVASVGQSQMALGNIPDLARVQYRTLTSRLADEVARQVGQGASSIAFVDLIENLRLTSQPQRMPEYKLRVGKVGIRVPNLGYSSVPPHLRLSGQQRRRASLSQPTMLAPMMSRLSVDTPRLSAVFKVHVRSDDPTGEEAHNLVKWVHSLSPALGLELVGVYKTHSTEFLFHAPYYVWAQLNGLPGYSLVCESIGRNLLPELVSKIETKAAPSRLTVQSENIPFQQRKQ